jgi:hypothetical protein
MTTTKATGRLALLESGFKVIPGKETDFQAYQATVVPLAMEQDGFRRTPPWGLQPAELRSAASGS